MGYARILLVRMRHLTFQELSHCLIKAIVDLAFTGSGKRRASSKALGRETEWSRVPAQRPRRDARTRFCSCSRFRPPNLRFENSGTMSCNIGSDSEEIPQRI